MKIAFVTQPGHAVDPAVGSIELWAENVARRLAERHDVTIYASRSPLERANADAVGYRFIAHTSGRRLTRVLRFAWRLAPGRRPFFASVFHPLEYWLRVALDVRKERHDVVHVFNHSQALPFLRRLTDARLVLHMHCEWLSQLDARMIERRLRHADLIVGCSDYITDKIRERFPRHANRCVTIYNGVDPPGATADDTRRLATVELLNVGRVSPEKGLHVLVDALDRVVRAHPEVRLTIVGEESPVPYEFAVKISSDPLVQDLGRFYGSSYLQHLRERMTPEVAARVTFIDRLPHEQTLDYYGRSDIFVFPSIFEAFPIPPIEAMAFGVPVVASKAGGTVESVVDERTGLLTQRDDPEGLAEAILRLVEQPELRRSLGGAGRERALELYSWDKVVGDVEEAFSGLHAHAEARDRRSTHLAELS